MAEELRMGMGSLTFWGSTPAYDLIEKFYKGEIKKPAEDPLKILLLGQSDARHILKTLANVSNADKALHFYIVESHPIQYARQLLLLHLAFLPLDEIGLHEKTTEFMEIFGNLLIRPQTKKTIQKACEFLIKVVTDNQSVIDKLPMINLDPMKFREKDILVEILKFWAECPVSAAEMQQLWDNRLRQYLTTRYDSRMGVFDWDYQMRMLEKNKDTKIVNVSEFKSWRNTGLAFNEYECDYNQANPTLLHAKGQPFHGDTLIGPFIPFGIHTNDESFFEKANEQYKKKSLDVTFHNLQEIFTILSPKTESDKSNLSQNFRIYFLPLDTCENLWKKSAFLEMFDMVYLSSFIGHKIIPEMVKLLKPDALVMVDQPRYVWYFRSENDKAYGKKVLELADKAGLKLTPMTQKDEQTPVAELTKDFLKFEIKKPTKDSDALPTEPEIHNNANTVNDDEEILNLPSISGAGDV